MQRRTKKNAGHDDFLIPGTGWPAGYLRCFSLLVSRSLARSDWLPPGHPRAASRARVGARSRRSGSRGTRRSRG